MKKVIFTLLALLMMQGVMVAQETGYYLVSDLNQWSTTDQSYAFTLQDDGVTWSISIPSVFGEKSTIYYKVAPASAYGNQDNFWSLLLCAPQDRWQPLSGTMVVNGGAWELSANANAEAYIIRINPSAMTYEVEVKMKADVELWTVAGDFAYPGNEDGAGDEALSDAIFGGYWKSDIAANDMVKEDDYYCLRISGLVLPVGCVRFKVCANHSWDECYGVDGNNFIIKINEPGTYVLNFYFYPDSKTVYGSAARMEDKTYTVAGWVKVDDVDNAELGAAVFTSSWNPSETANDMVKEGGTYSLMKKNVSLKPCTICFKVVANHSWDENYGDGGGDVVYPITQAGTYDLCFIFDPVSKMVDLIPTMTAPESISTSALGEVTSTVYDLRGCSYGNLKAQEINNLPRGIYVVGGRKVVK